VFVWRYLDAQGERVGESEPFEERQAAETWLGEVWADLLTRGVEEVALIDQARELTLYRMGLREA
jgi:hypothetical protein